MLEHLDTFIAQQRSDNTKRAYRNDLARWEAFLDGREPTQALVAQFRMQLEAVLAPSSAARTFNTVRSFYRWAGGDDPTVRIKAPQRITGVTPKCPSDRDVEALVAQVDTSTLQGLRDRAVIALLLNNLRASEVVDLTVDSMVWEEAYGAHVLTVRGKGMKQRLVPAIPEAVEAVQAYRDAIPDVISGWLIPDISGNGPTKLTYKQVEHAVYRWAKRAGVEGMHPHALRHHYATRMVRAGVDILTLQKLLGHSRADTTQLYVTLDMSDLVNASRLDPRAHQEERPLLRVVNA